ncbi:MAG: MFS transporter [Oligoflexales bacterium]
MAATPIISLVFMVIGSGFFMSFISLYFKNLQLSDMDIGFVQSCFYLGLLCSSLLSEKLIARIGHIRTLTATCGLLSASTLVLSLIPVQYWFLFRFFAGGCVGCSYVCFESWLLAEYSVKERGYAMAIYTAALYSSQSVSQLLLPFFYEGRYMFAYMVSAFCVSLAAVPVSVGKKNGPDFSMVEPGSFLKFFKLTPLGVTGCFVAGMMLSTFYSFMPIYFEEKGLSPGVLMFFMVAGGAVLQLPLGKLSDQIERRKILTGLSLVSACSCFVLLSVEGASAISVVSFFLGGFCFAIYPISMALGCDCVEQKDLVKMTGLLLFSYGVGSVLGPVVTPLLKYVVSDYTVVTLLVYSLLLSVIGIYALTVKANIPLEDQTTFNVIPTVPMVEELHPSIQENQADEPLKAQI